MDKYFADVFDKWADDYDNTVASDKGEYAEVFLGYPEIIKTVVDMIGDIEETYVVDIGSGTGNLAYEAHKKGYISIGVEPNRAMREIALKKYPQIRFCQGDFFKLPSLDKGIGAVISSYAFHHLTDTEKGKAAGLYNMILPKGGKVIIADTMYETDKDRIDIRNDAKEKGYMKLLGDLDTEFYTVHDVLKKCFTAAGFNVTFKRMNKFVWILYAEKEV